MENKRKIKQNRVQKKFKVGNKYVSELTVKMVPFYLSSEEDDERIKRLARKILRSVERIDSKEFALKEEFKSDFEKKLGI